VTTALLLYGGAHGPEPQDLLTLKAIANLLDQAQRTFLEIHHAIEAEEAAIRGTSTRVSDHGAGLGASSSA
jgi:hypothetical protein